ncbi:MAG: terminase small subunit [Bacteroidota bacterium]
MKYLKDLKQLKSYRARINKYFTTLQGAYHTEKVPVKGAKDHTETIDQKVWDREPEPATLSGLALAIGFTSINEMEAYEREGKFAPVVKKARLRVEAEYEKKLHFQSSTGAIFFLKNLGWNEKTDDFLQDIPKTIKIEIIDPGTKLAGTEKEVDL